MKHNNITINIYACGGGGINIVNKSGLVSKITELTGDAYPLVKCHYFDTSMANYSEFMGKDFTLVTEQTLTNVNVAAGTNGDRSYSAAMADAAIREYIDKNKIGSGPNEIHIVIGSGAGGSGSTIAPTLVAYLGKKDLPVLPIMAGDSKDLESVKSTRRTLLTYRRIATDILDKPIGLIYCDNNQYSDDYIKAINQANETIKNMVMFIIMLCGDNQNIDYADIKGWINPSKSVIPVSNIYNINITTMSGDVKLSGESKVLVSRILTSENNSKPIQNLETIHSKVGIINSDISSGLDDELFPLGFILSTGYFEAESIRLENIEKDKTSLLEKLVTPKASDIGTINGMIIV